MIPANLASADAWIEVDAKSVIAACELTIQSIMNTRRERDAVYEAEWRKPSMNNLWRGRSGMPDLHSIHYPSIYAWGTLGACESVLNIAKIAAKNERSVYISHDMANAINLAP